MASLAQLRIEYPAFADLATYPDALMQAWLDKAIRLVNPDFGDCYDDAVYALTLHLFVSQRGAMSEGKTSVKAGPASVTYASPMSRDGLASTSFGRAYSFYARIAFGSQVVP